MTDLYHIDQYDGWLGLCLRYIINDYQTLVKQKQWLEKLASIRADDKMI